MNNTSRTLTPAARKLTLIAGEQVKKGLVSSEEAERTQIEGFRLAFEVAGQVFLDGRWKNVSIQMLKESGLTQEKLKLQSPGENVPKGSALGSPELTELAEAVLDIYKSNSYDTRSARRLVDHYTQTVAKFG
jgi:hypothetical protein